MIGRYLARRRFMREHRWTHSHLSALLDGELGAEDAARAKVHVSLCPQCTRVLATMRRTLRGLRSLPRESPPGLADYIVARLRRES